MSEILRTAIIGLGPCTPGKGGGHSFAYSHGWGVAACPDLRLVAGVSRTPKNVADFCAEFPGCKGYADYREMMRVEKPDLVSICAFPNDREAMVTAALDAGARGVWIEKPFATSLGAAQRMMAHARQKKARLFVNHQRRYGAPFEWFRDAARQKKIGELISVDIVQHWGGLMNFPPHLIDAALFAIGSSPAVKMFAGVDWSTVGDYQGTPVEVHSLAAVHFADGVRLTIETGSLEPVRWPVLRAHGTEGFAELHMDVKPGMQSVFRARYAGEPATVSPPTNEHFHHTEDIAFYMKRAAADVAGALLKGSATRIDVEEAYRGLEILMGIFESARTSRVVTFPLKTGEATPFAAR